MGTGCVWEPAQPQFTRPGPPVSTSRPNQDRFSLGPQKFHPAHLFLCFPTIDNMFSLALLKYSLCALAFGFLWEKMNPPSGNMALICENMRVSFLVWFCFTLFLSPFQRHWWNILVAGKTHFKTFRVALHAANNVLSLCAEYFQTFDKMQNVIFVQQPIKKLHFFLSSIILSTFFKQTFFPAVLAWTYWSKNVFF